MLTHGASPSGLPWYHVHSRSIAAPDYSCSACHTHYPAKWDAQRCCKAFKEEPPLAFRQAEGIALAMTDPFSHTPSTRDEDNQVLDPTAKITHPDKWGHWRRGRQGTPEQTTSEYHKAQHQLSILHLHLQCQQLSLTFGEAIQGPMAFDHARLQPLSPQEKELLNPRLVWPLGFLPREVRRQSSPAASAAHYYQMEGIHPIPTAQAISKARQGDGAPPGDRTPPPMHSPSPEGPYPPQGAGEGATLGLSTPSPPPPQAGGVPGQGQLPQGPSASSHSLSDDPPESHPLSEGLGEGGGAQPDRMVRYPPLSAPVHHCHFLPAKMPYTPVCFNPACPILNEPSAPQQHLKAAACYYAKLNALLPPSLLGMPRRSPKKGASPWNIGRPHV